MSNEEIEQLNYDIDNLVWAVSTLIFCIKDLDDLIENTELDPIIEEAYTQQMMEVIDEYKIVCDELTIKLKQYQQYERDNNLPPNFNYHRLLKEIKKI